MSSKNKRILAIEAAVGGGSISLIEGGDQIAGWTGSGNVSRAENLLPNISDVLIEGRLDRKHLDLIAVSNGPGSYTGIRIGIATALGLANGLNIKWHTVPLMHAMAEFAGETLIAVIPIGKTGLCWQAFERADGAIKALNDAATGQAADFIVYSKSRPDIDLVIQHDAFENLAPSSEFQELMPRATNFGRNLALAIGLASAQGGSEVGINYIQNPNFSSNPLAS